MENNKEYQKWLDEVSHMGWKLRDVPDEFKTYEICRVALDNEFHLNKYCLKHVPEEFHKELAEEFGIELPKTR